MKKTFRVMLVFIAMIVVIFSFASCDKISEGGHDHKYDEWIKKTSPTCTDAGEWVRYCECGERQTETFPPVGHDFENGVCKSCAVNDPSYKAEDEGNDDHDKDATVIVPNNLVKGTFGYENWTVFEDAIIEGVATSPIEIANAIVNSGILPFMAGAMEIAVDTEYFTGFDDYTIEGYESCAAFMPMMGAIPYVGYIFELEDGVDVYNFIDDLTVNANPRWNICVEADETLVGAFGNTVFFIMCPDRIETDEESCNGNHDFGDWTAYEDGATDCGLKRYYRICENCETKEERSGSYDDHFFTTVTTAPTCTNVGYDTNTCQLCGRVEICNETEKLPHDRSESYLFNEEKHWKICGICENVVSEGEHVFDEGVCLVCDPSVLPTEGVIYEKSADGTFARVVGYEGTSSKVKIAEEYDGLPVREIGDSAFEYNDSISTIIISDSVTNIGDDVFYCCIELSCVVVPDSVVSIGLCAFAYCNSLVAVTIHENVVNIEGGAFGGCHNLVSIEVASNSRAYKSIDGNLYSKDGKKLISYAAGKNDTEFVIPDGVESVEYGSLWNCDKLTSITIPKSVSSIAIGAIISCSSLEIIESDFDNETYKTIDGNLYSKDGKKLVLYAPKKNDMDLVVPDGVEIIACSAIDAFPSFICFKSITLPESVMSIESGAFYGRDSLTDVYYTGSEEEWKQITIDEGNSCLLNATIHYNYSPEVE